jgi:hypothetical protein
MGLSPGTPTGKVQEAMRCRYCVEEHSFLEMNPEPDGRFVCRRCGHVEQPSDPDFPCACRKCIRAFLFSHDHRLSKRLTGQREPLG